MWQPFRQCSSGVGMRIIALILICVTALTACQKRKDQIAFDGQFFRASASSTREDRTTFDITVRPFSSSPKGALEAGRYQATVYCIKRYGVSAVDWETDPYQDPDTYAVDNDTLELRGRCIE